jgi:hypothetical protein
MSSHHIKHAATAVVVAAAALLPAVATVAGATTLAAGSTGASVKTAASGAPRVMEDAVGDDHASHAHGHSQFRGLETARSATARFHRVATAEQAGYARLAAPAHLHECIDTDVDLDDQDGKPAMGIHWVNGALLDGTVDVRKPEVLVYEPKRNGQLELVALEYVVFEADWGARGTRPAPQLFGQEFMYVAAPNRYDLPAFYALHAWVWKSNPDGPLAAMNPWVSCRYAAQVPTT